MARRTSDQEVARTDALSSIDFGGWPGALVMPPVIVAAFLVGMAAPWSDLYVWVIALLSLPVIIGVMGFRRRGAASFSARTVQRLGWGYLAWTGFLLLVVALP
jgi:hypothetical protein